MFLIHTWTIKNAARAVRSGVPMDCIANPLKDHHHKTWPGRADNIPVCLTPIFRLIGCGLDCYKLEVLEVSEALEALEVLVYSPFWTMFAVVGP